MRRHPNRWGFPDMGLGMGLRSKHYPDILESNPPVAFFEKGPEPGRVAGGHVTAARPFSAGSRAG
ncbi:hypothetical protein DYH09_10655 [bacterium CPR1]|nr:hypothetical protein [bacterium CPR1]